MKKLIITVLAGCIFLGTNNAYSNAIPCDATAPLQDCFDLNRYVTPVKLYSSISPVAKMWTSPAFLCSGTYNLAVYLHNNQIPSKFWFDTTCPTSPTLSDIVVKNGQEIEQMLTQCSSPCTGGLNLEEVRSGGTPVIFDITFTGGGTGVMNVSVSTEAWSTTDDPPAPPTADLEITPRLAYGYIPNRPITMRFDVDIVNFGPNDSPGTIATFDLAGDSFELLRITKGNMWSSSNFQWNKNGRRITVNMGSVPSKSFSQFKVYGEATRNCSDESFVATVTGDLDDPDLSNNSSEYIGGIIQEQWPEYCQIINLVPVRFLLDSKKE